MAAKMVELDGAACGPEADAARRRLVACGYPAATAELKMVHCNDQAGCENLAWIENGFIQCAGGAETLVRFSSF